MLAIMTYYTEIEHKETLKYYVHQSYYIGCYSGLANTYKILPPDLFRFQCSNLTQGVNDEELIEFLGKLRENTNGEF